MSAPVLYFRYAVKSTPRVTASLKRFAENPKYLENAMQLPLVLGSGIAQITVCGIPVVVDELKNLISKMTYQADM